MKNIFFLLILFQGALYGQSDSLKYRDEKYSTGINAGGLIRSRIEIVNEYKVNSMLSINNSLGYYFKTSSYDYINSYDNKVKGPFFRIGPRLLIPVKNIRFYFGGDLIISRVYHTSVISIEDYYGTVERTSSFTANVKGFGLNTGIVILLNRIQFDLGLRYNQFSAKQNYLVTKKGFIQPGFGNVNKYGNQAISFNTLLAIRYNFSL